MKSRFVGVNLNDVDPELPIGFMVKPEFRRAVRSVTFSVQRSREIPGWGGKYSACYAKVVFTTRIREKSSIASTVFLKSAAHKMKQFRREITTY